MHIARKPFTGRHFSHCSVKHSAVKGFSGLYVLFDQFAFYLYMGKMLVPRGLQHFQAVLKINKKILPVSKSV
jgi:hypothetical protein